MKCWVFNRQSADDALKLYGEDLRRLDYTENEIIHRVNGARTFLDSPILDDMKMAIYPAADLKLDVDK